MSNERAFDESQIPSAEERDFVRSIQDRDHQAVVACSLIKHRRPDRLAPGDPVPTIELTSLEPEGTQTEVSLAAKRDRPLFLIFGSYT